MVNVSADLVRDRLNLTESDVADENLEVIVTTSKTLTSTDMANIKNMLPSLKY